MWDEQFNSFGAEGFRVIRYDMRGLGKSDKPKSKYDDATDLMELLDRVGWNEKLALSTSPMGQCCDRLCPRIPD